MKKWAVCLLLTAYAVLSASDAAALQPLQTFLQSAQQYNPSNRESQADLDAALAQHTAAVGALLPSLRLSGAYTRNQYETVMSPGTPQETVITPEDQLDGAATLALPLIDLAGYWQTRATRAQARSSKWRQAATAIEVESRVVETYYQVIADVGLVAACERALEVSQAGLELARTLFQSGMVPSLDVDRAEAEVESQRQQLTAARFQLEVDARALRSLTGIEPDTTDIPSLNDDLHEEPPLETFESSDMDLPVLAAAVEDRRAQHEQTTAQRLATLPALGSSFTENATNASGLGGHEQYWQAMLTLSWGFDLPKYANISVNNARLRAAQAREDNQRLAAQDAIHRAWHAVQAAIARCRSARQQTRISRHAAELARDRYSVGMTTQLDLLQAERDAFKAEINQILTEADLADARAQLLLAAGRPLVSSNEVMP